MLRLESVSKSFGKKAVLRDVSADFPQGSTTLITGPSGIGKTTLLRIISGLEVADSGRVVHDGNAVISFMFQEPRLFPWLSAIKNVSVVGGSSDASEQLLRELGMEGALELKPAELSGGMQRRVAIARTLLYPADIFLFDEPFAGLDPSSAAVAANVISRYTVGGTVIIVSHDRSMLPADIVTLDLGHSGTAETDT